jgi:hypothetical protein
MAVNAVLCEVNSHRRMLTARCTGATAAAAAAALLLCCSTAVMLTPLLRYMRVE